MSKDEPGNALGRARAEKSEHIRKSVERAVDQLVSQGCKPSFYAVSKLSGVSRSTLYRRADLRARIEAARAETVAEPHESKAADQLAAQVGELSKEIRELRNLLHAFVSSSGWDAAYAASFWIEYDVESALAA